MKEILGYRVTIALTEEHYFNWVDVEDAQLWHNDALANGVVSRFEVITEVE